jgi:hypothetical protein
VTSLFDALSLEAQTAGAVVFERQMKGNNKGLYADGVIWISKGIPTTAEKSCILAEELGHHHTSAGDITDQLDIRNRKQEKRARHWAHERLVPLSGIVEASLAGVKTRSEIAEFLEITEEFLEAALHRYRDKYGLYVGVDRYVIHFEPLYVLEIF